MKLKKVVNTLPAVVVALIVGTGLQSCFNNDDFYDMRAILDEDIASIEQYLDDNNIVATEDENSGIFIADHGYANGWRPWRNATVTVHFVGTTLDGTEFVSTYDEGSPRTFQLGSVAGTGSTEGLQYAITLINQGDSVTAYIPSIYGFRNIGTDKVPPNTVIKYDIRLLDINRLDEDYSDIDSYAMDEGFFGTLEVDEIYGTRFARHVQGTGSKIKEGDIVSLFYAGQLLNGEQFDSNFGKLIPYEVTIGSNQVISGFEMGLLNLYEGDSATIFIPSTYGYRDQPQRDGDGNVVIPANSVLVFGIKVADIFGAN
jgi:FKBP-type peptidyl-prolyl cis-trans isomerase